MRHLFIDLCARLLGLFLERNFGEIIRTKETNHFCRRPRWPCLRRMPPRDSTDWRFGRHEFYRKRTREREQTLLAGTRSHRAFRPPGAACRACGCYRVGSRCVFARPWADPRLPIFDHARASVLVSTYAWKCQEQQKWPRWEAWPFRERQMQRVEPQKRHPPQKPESASNVPRIHTEPDVSGSACLYHYGHFRRRCHVSSLCSAFWSMPLRRPCFHSMWPNGPNGANS